MGKNVWGIVSG